MNETQAILEAWQQLKSTGDTAFLATVVQTEGSTYRRAGARMLFTSAGWIAGSISGGCLEADMLQTARERTANGPVLVTYDSTANEDIVWGFGLGCNGVVHVLLERLEATKEQNGGSEVLAFLQTCHQQRVPGVIASVLRVQNAAGEPSPVTAGSRLMLSENEMQGNGSGEGDLRHSQLLSVLLRDMADVRQQGKNEVRAYTVANARVEISLECILPSRPLVVFGAGQDALPVVILAKQMGWHVTVVDPRSTLLSAERFAAADAIVGCTPDALSEKIELTTDTFTLLMTHNFLHDADFLAQLLASQARYIGVLGPKKRLHRLLEHLEREGITPTDAQLARLHGPVGLDIGADNPDEIALSIVAELQAVATGHIGGALRERDAPLHAATADKAAPKATTEPDRKALHFTCALT